MLKLKVLKEYDMAKDCPNTFAMAVKEAKKINGVHIVTQTICQGERNAIYQLNTYSDGQSKLLDKNMRAINREYIIKMEIEK